MPRTAKPFEQCYMIDVATGCWLWTQHIGRGGYGFRNLRRLPGRKPVVSAHRASWEIHRGSIPDGVNVLHKCDVRSCVNPDHLFLGDQKQNVADAVARNRGAQFVKRDVCKYGHPMTEANTYARPDNGYRYCRQCMRAKKKANYRRDSSWVMGLLFT